MMHYGNLIIISIELVLTSSIRMKPFPWFDTALEERVAVSPFFKMKPHTHKNKIKLHDDEFDDCI